MNLFIAQTNGLDFYDKINCFHCFYFFKFSFYFNKIYKKIQKLFSFHENKLKIIHYLSVPSFLNLINLFDNDMILFKFKISSIRKKFK